MSSHSFGFSNGLILRLAIPRPEGQRIPGRGRMREDQLTALLILLTLGVPVHADDPIAEWLKQDESDDQNDQVRPDLNALTDQQLQTFSRLAAIKQTAMN